MVEKEIITTENTEKYGEKSRFTTTIQITCKKNLKKSSLTDKQ
ncbi:MAG: hypothetical protein ACP5UA_05560 [Candidatus Hydrogenedens sp.]